MTTIVFIETNFSGLEAIEYCQSKKYRTVLVTDSIERFRNWFPASALSKLDKVDQIVKVPNSDDFEGVLEALEKEVREIDAILTFAEIRTRVTAELSGALELPGARVAAVKIAQDKYQFRQVLLEKSTDDVQAVKIDSIEELLSLDGKIGFPCFIKPVQGHSSIGAVVCKEAADAKKIVTELSNIDEDWISPSFVVEDYLQGKLVSVEILTRGPGKHAVVGVSDRDVIKDSIEVGASFPLDSDQTSEAVEKACAALDAIGYDFGPSHVEVILTDSGAHLVEVNCRVGGSGHSVMLDLATSRSIVGDYVELCLGNLSNKNPLYEPIQGAAWKCFTTTASGTIRSLPSVESVKQLPGVREVWLHHEVGEEINGVSSNFSWIVQVMCIGADQTEAKARAADAIDSVAKIAEIT